MPMSGCRKNQYSNQNNCVRYLTFAYTICSLAFEPRRQTPLPASALGEQSNYRAAIVSNAVLPNKIGRKSNLATNRARQHLRYKACSSRNVAEAKT